MARYLFFGSPGSRSEEVAIEFASVQSFKLIKLSELFEVPEKKFEMNVPGTKEQARLKESILQEPNLVFSGSLCRFDQGFIDCFDQVIFCSAPRLHRLQVLREFYLSQEGEEILQEGTKAFKKFNQFMYYASQYDQGGPDRESKISHENYLRLAGEKAIRLSTTAGVESALNSLSQLLE